MIRRLLAATVLATVVVFAVVTTAAWSALLIWSGYQGVRYVVLMVF